MQKMSETESWFSEKDKIDKPLAGFIKKKEKGLKIRNEREFTTDTTAIQ